MHTVVNQQRRSSRFKRWLRLQMRSVLRENSSPLRTSAGLALGAFIGILPSFLLGTPIGFYLAGRLGLNRAAAVIGTLFTNPVTAPVFYSISTSLGLQMLGQQEGITAGAAFPSIIRHYGAAFLIGNATFASAFAITCGLLAYAFFILRGTPDSPNSEQAPRRPL